MGGYKEKDAAKDTDSSSGKVAEAWHDSRSDSGARSGKDKANFREGRVGNWGTDYDRSHLPERSRERK